MAKRRFQSEEDEENYDDTSTPETGESGATNPGRTLRDRKDLLEKSSELTDDDDLWDMLDDQGKKLHRRN